MSVIVKYSSGSAYTLVPEKVETELIQDISVYHIPLSNFNRATRSGLGFSRITIIGTVEDKRACLWHDIEEVSFNSGTTYQAVYFSSASFADDLWSSLYPYTLTLIASPILYAASVSSATVWGLATVSGIHQHGNVAGQAGIVYLGPDCYFPLVQSLSGIGNQSVGFTRELAKTVNGVVYPVNAPVFGIAGLLVSETTSQDVPTILMPVAAVRTIACKVKNATATTGTVTVWTATKNKLTIDLTNNLLKWTDDTTTVQCTFPTTAYLAGTVVTVVAIEGASHGVSIVCRAAGGSWTGNGGTLAAILWTNILTFGNLKGSLAHLIQWPYVLAEAEYQAIHFAAGPLIWNTMSIAHKRAGTLTLDEDGVLRDAAGTDYSGLVAGRITLPAGGTAVDVAMTEGLSSRWTATARDTSI